MASHTCLASVGKSSSYGYSPHAFWIDLAVVRHANVWDSSRINEWRVRSLNDKHHIRTLSANDSKLSFIILKLIKAGRLLLLCYPKYVIHLIKHVLNITTIGDSSLRRSVQRAKRCCSSIKLRFRKVEQEEASIAPWVLWFWQWGEEGSKYTFAHKHAASLLRRVLYA